MNYEKINSQRWSRMQRTISATVAGGFAIAGLSASLAAHAADYPLRPVRLIVPFAAGSNIDGTARQIAPKLSDVLGQQIVVDNRGGAGGTIGATLAARAQPDGYTILMGNAPTHGMAPHLYKNLAYDPIKDFTPIGRIDSASFVLVVSAGLPVHSVADLISHAKSKPGLLNYASSGNGTTAHLSGTLFNHKAGVNMKHIPYNNVPQAFVDIASGAVAVMFYPYQPLMPLIQTQKARMLATTGMKRASYLPNVPTVIEAGIPDFSALAWHGFYGPARTPPRVVDILYAAAAKTMADPKVVASLVATGIDVDLAPPREFAAFTKAEIERYRQLIAMAGSAL
jgi:tripartite-type tricarboxylate transporter receptor subunit TctC